MTEHLKAKPIIPGCQAIAIKPGSVVPSPFTVIDRITETNYKARRFYFDDIGCWEIDYPHPEGGNYAAPENGIMRIDPDDPDQATSKEKEKELEQA